MKFAYAAIAGAALIVVSASARAQTGDTWTDCSTGTDIDKTITACTAVIDSGTESGARLARAYFQRGFNESLKASGATNRAELDAQAISDLSKTLETDPNNKDAWGIRGNIYFEDGRYNDAIANFERVEKLDPGNDVGNFLAHSYERTGQPQKALAAFGVVIKHHSKNAWAYSARGDFYSRNNQPALAITDYSTAIKLDMKDGMSSYTADLYYRRGLAKSAKGNAAGAAADIAKAKSIYPGIQTPDKDD